MGGGTGRRRILIAGGLVLIAICTWIIFGQTVHVAPIDYDDHFYLTVSPYVAVWNAARQELTAALEAAPDDPRLVLVEAELLLAQPLANDK